MSESPILSSPAADLSAYHQPPKFGSGYPYLASMRFVLTPLSGNADTTSRGSPFIHPECAVAAREYVRPSSVLTSVRYGEAFISDILTGFIRTRTSPQSPIQMVGWRVRINPSRFSSSALKLSRPIRFVRVIGTRWNDPNGTHVFGCTPPYCVPTPSVPTKGSTQSSDAFSATDAAVICNKATNATKTEPTLTPILFCILFTLLSVQLDSLLLYFLSLRPIRI